MIDSNILTGYNTAPVSFAVNNGSGCTGCKATDAHQRLTCMWRMTGKERDCGHLRFDEYCDNPKAQMHAKGLSV